MSENDVIASITKMLENFKTEKAQKRFKKWNKIMSFNFTDLNKTYYTIITEGIPGEVVEGKPEKADIIITTDSETWNGILNGTISGMSAYTSKRLKVKGKMTDLLKLQKVMK